MHVCQQCGCDVFTLVDRNGFKIPECMGCGSDKPPIKTGINRDMKGDGEIPRWNPDKAKDDLKYKDIRYWENLRKEWRHEWFKRVGSDRSRRQRRN